jgi:predicted NAD/FAD-binding protein
MSFAASLNGGAFEYSGSGLSGMLGQRSNALRPRFWSMMSHILRFYREAPSAVTRAETSLLTLGDFLDRQKYSRAFVEDHLLPMGAAIWSTCATDMRNYPLEAFVRFFMNHGLLQLKDRPQWRTVKGGSREYVRRMLADFEGKVRLGSRVIDIRRDDLGATVTCADGHAEHFEQVVVAAHADQALAMLGDGDAQERALLGAFGYTPNTAVLHSDASLMPKRRSVWASWNYIAGTRQDGTAPLCVTYWMNRLQNLDPALPLFVTLNPCRSIDPSKVHATFDYAHPRFDAQAMAAQKQIWQLQGRRHTWFCGAHFGSGFHEDGLQSGLAVAEQLSGLSRPWSVENQSGRIFLDEQRMAAE